MKSRELTLEARGDREIAWSRVFDAPRQMVFDAHTKPELLKRWMYGPDGWSLAVCEVDLRVGGSYLWVWKKADVSMTARGVYREIDAPARIVNTERFDNPWYPGEGLVTTVFTESLGQTMLNVTMRFESAAARDVALKSGMDTGMEACYARIEQIAKEVPA